MKPPRISSPASRAAVLALALAVLFPGPAPALRGGQVYPPWPALSEPAAPAGGGGQDAAVIAGIEEYSSLPRLAGARANAWAWFDYFNKTRGVPGMNITMLLDAEATDEALRDAVSRAASLAGPGGTLWLVFIGYGSVDASGRDILLPQDAQRGERGGYGPGTPRKVLLEAMSQGKNAGSAAVLDACSPEAARPGGVRTSSPGAPGVVSLSYVRGAECRASARLSGLERPALSYLTLGGLRGWADKDGDRKITAGELSALVSRALPPPAAGGGSAAHLAGDVSGVLGLSPGEAGPDIAAMGRAASPVVDPGKIFRAGVQPALPPGMDARAWTRDTDWNKVSRMLSYAADEDEKERLAAAFVKAHGTSPDEDPYVVYLLPFLDMALIPSGGFFMGSPAGEGGDDESPRREVYLGAFSMDRREVTAGDYRVFAAATGRPMPEQPEWSASSYPVVNVDWSDASAYCEWAGKRLPTEAEWEKAARGGSLTRYSFGDDEGKLGEYAWYHANSEGRIHPVGLKKPNQYGLYDMAGNAWEWVADRYGMNYYREAPSENPKGPGAGAQRVQRGGSCSFFDVSPRPGDRGSGVPTYKSPRGGFRCVF